MISALLVKRIGKQETQQNSETRDPIIINQHSSWKIKSNSNHPIENRDMPWSHSITFVLLKQLQFHYLYWKSVEAQEEPSQVPLESQTPYVSSLSLLAPAQPTACSSPSWNQRPGVPWHNHKLRSTQKKHLLNKWWMQKIQIKFCNRTEAKL